MPQKSVKPILKFKDMYVFNGHQEQIIITDIIFEINGNLVANGEGFTNNGAPLVWEINDGGTITTFTQNTTPAYTLINATASVKISSSEAFVNVVQILLRNQKIYNTLDITVLTEISGQVQVDRNPGLKHINFPSNSNAFTLIRAYSCDLTGVLDLRPLINLSGGIELHLNPNLTQVLFPVITSAIINLRLYSCNLTGTLDLTNILYLGGAIRLYSNPNLTNVTFQASSQTINILSIYSCNLTGVLNLSMLTGLGGNIELSNNPNLTNVLFPAVSANISLTAINTGISGVFDISNLTGLGGSFQMSGCLSLTGLLFPVSNKTFTQLLLNNCSLTGTLNLSTLTGLGGLVRLYSNPNLTNVTLPTTSGVFTGFQAYSCNLDYINFTTMVNMMNINNCSILLQNNSMIAADVNHILVDLYSLVSGEVPGGAYTGRTINIGETNADPDTTSGGYNGTAAKTALEAKGITVTII